MPFGQPVTPVEPQLPLTTSLPSVEVPAAGRHCPFELSAGKSSVQKKTALPLLIAGLARTQARPKKSASGSPDQKKSEDCCSIDWLKTHGSCEWAAGAIRRPTATAATA